MHRRLFGFVALAAVAGLAFARDGRLPVARSDSPDGGAAQAKKPGEAQKPGRPSAAEIFRRLNQPADFLRIDPTALDEVLEHFSQALGLPPILIDRAAFKADNPDAADIQQTPVQLPLLKGVPRAKALRILLDQYPGGNATYLVRPGYLEITTREAATPGRQTVQGVFVKQPLEEAIQELAEQTGLSVVLDARAADKARVPVTATFRGDTNLLNAVRLLADMAGLKTVVADSVVYVTVPQNKTQFLPTVPGLLPGAAQ